MKDVEILKVVACKCTDPLLYGGSGWTADDNVHPVTIYEHKGCRATWGNDDGCPECSSDGEVVTVDGCSYCLTEYVRADGWYCEDHNLVNLLICPQCKIELKGK